MRSPRALAAFVSLTSFRIRDNAARARGDLTGDLDYYQDRGNSKNNNTNNSNKNNTSVSTRGSGGERGKYDLFRPVRTAVAYDSELDMESFR